MKLQQGRGTRIIIKHLKSHGGLRSTCNGCKKEQGAWGSLRHMSCSFRVLLPSEDVLYAVVAAICFQKINPHLEAKQATTVFARGVKEKHIKEMRCILLWKTDKTVVNLSYCSVLLYYSWIELDWEVDLDNQNIQWATKPRLVVAPGTTGHKNQFQTLRLSDR